MNDPAPSPTTKLQEILAKLGSLGSITGDSMRAFGEASATAPSAVPTPPRARPRPDPRTVRSVWEGRPNEVPHRLATDGKTFLAHEAAEQFAACGEPIWQLRDLGLPPEAEAFLARGVRALDAIDGVAMALRTVAVSQLAREAMADLAKRTLAAFGLEGGESVLLPKPAPMELNQTGTSTATFGLTVVAVEPRTTLTLVVQADEPPRVGDVVRFPVGHADQVSTRVRQVLPKDPGSFDLLVDGPVPEDAIGRAWIERLASVMMTEDDGVRLTLELDGDVLTMARSDLPSANSRVVTEPGDALRFADLAPDALAVLAKVVVLACRGERRVRKALADVSP